MTRCAYCNDDNYANCICMSKTPRTDAAEIIHPSNQETGFDHRYVPSDLAREFELKLNTEKSLADRLFDLDHIDMTLFEMVNKLLGCDTDKCTDPGFVWECIDTFWDTYDNSIEIIRPEGRPPITSDQAKAIIEATGFTMIWESIGDKCYVWDVKGSCGESQNPKKGNDRTASYRRVAQLERELNEAKIQRCEASVAKEFAELACERAERKRDDWRKCARLLVKAIETADDGAPPNFYPVLRHFDELEKGVK